MRHDVIAPAPAQTGDATAAPVRSMWRRVAMFLVHLVMGLLVFCGTCAGWIYHQNWRDRHSPLPNGGAAQRCSLWFVGSSSMHKWITLQDDMLPWRTHNRGVDGARLGYLLDRFSSEPGASPPRAIVLYAGENDIAQGASADETQALVERFVAEKRRLYGALPMFVVSVKPSPTRWHMRPEQARLNTELAAFARRGTDVHFVNIVPLMMVNGRPGPFYQQDGIHLSHVGYRLWGGAVRQALQSTLPRDLVRSCRSPGAQG